MQFLSSNHKWPKKFDVLFWAEKHNLIEIYASCAYMPDTRLPKHSIWSSAMAEAYWMDNKTISGCSQCLCEEMQAPTDTLEVLIHVYSKAVENNMEWYWEPWSCAYRSAPPLKLSLISHCLPLLLKNLWFDGLISYLKAHKLDPEELPKGRIIAQ